MIQSLNVLMSQANKSLLLEALSTQVDGRMSGISLRSVSEGIIAACNNAVSIISLAEKYHPKSVLMDLFLDDMDAFAVIKTLKERMGLKSPRVTVLCDFTAPRLERELYDAGASAVFTKPVKPEVLFDLLCFGCDGGSSSEPFDENSVVNESSSDTGIRELEVTVTDMMHQLGVPAHIKGYQYIRFAIIMSVMDPGMINAVTKRLYPTVAEKFNTTPSRVERAIRHAIEVAWARGDIDMLNSYFGYTIHNSRGKPTNSEFVAMLSDKLRIGMLSAG